MKTLFEILGVLALVGLFSCANMFNGVVLPNQCKKCAVVQLSTGDTLFANEGCGSANTGLEEEAKLQAYELGKNGYDFYDLDVVCESWKKDPEEEE